MLQNVIKASSSAVLTVLRRQDGARVRPQGMHTHTHASASVQVVHFGLQERNLTWMAKVPNKQYGCFNRLRCVTQDRALCTLDPRLAAQRPELLPP